MKPLFDRLTGKSWDCRECGFNLNKDEETREKMMEQYDTTYVISVNCPNCGELYEADESQE